jgi:opacity protein-like surface antigen
MRKLFLATIAALVPAAALAYGVDDVQTPPPPPPPPHPSYNNGEIFAGLGFGDFTSQLNTLSNVGVAWTLRGGVNFMRYLGAELSYQGTSTNANTVVVNGANIGTNNFVEQQLTADLKLGYPVLIGGEHVLRPYALAGVGYGWLGLNSAFGGMGLTNQNSAAFPFGAGLSYTPVPWFILDARFSYTALTQSLGDNWNVVINLGANIPG